MPYIWCMGKPPDGVCVIGSCDDAAAEPSPDGALLFFLVRLSVGGLAAAASPSCSPSDSDPEVDSEVEDDSLGWTLILGVPLAAGPVAVLAGFAWTLGVSASSTAT